MKRFLIVMTLLWLVVACNRPDFVDIIKLGALEKEMTVSMGAEEGAINLITNVPFETAIVSGREWLTLAGQGLMPASRTQIPFRCKENISWKRMAKVILFASGRVDTVYIKQEGALRDTVRLKYNVFDVPAKGGLYTTEFECFRYPDKLQSVYPNDAWEVSAKSGILSVKVPPAVSRDPKTYTVTVYYVNGWGEQTRAVATFNQEAKE